MKGADHEARKEEAIRLGPDVVGSVGAGGEQIVGDLLPVVALLQRGQQGLGLGGQVFIRRLTPEQHARLAVAAHPGKGCVDSLLQPLGEG